MDDRKIKQWLGQGISLHEAGRRHEAMQYYRQVIAWQPDNLEALNNLAIALKQEEQYPEAIALLRQGLTLKQNGPYLHNNLANILWQTGELEAARQHYHQALEGNPDYADAWYGLGNVFSSLGELDRAVHSYQQALTRKPNYPDSHNNLGNVFQSQGKLSAAFDCYQKTLQLNPNHPGAKWNQSFTLLLAGDLQRGFIEYEWRWQMKGGNFRSPRNYPQPLWDGTDIWGKTIFLHCEQGFGDSIQFIRYVSLVKQRVGQEGRVILECPKPLLRLFQGISSIDQLIPEGQTLPDFDVYAPLMSLPRLFGTTLETIPADIPYIYAEKNAPSLPLPREASEDGGVSMKIGIVWAGKPFYKSDRCRYRACSLEHFLELFNFERVANTQIQRYSLQKETTEAELSLLSANQIVNLGSYFNDFADTANAIASLDLVITVDTAVAHLAAAMGKKVWVLLPFAPDWRWMLNREDSPWYPKHMRLFRPSKPGDWEGIFQQVKLALQGYSGTPLTPLTPLTKGGTGSPLAPLTKGGTGSPLTPLTKGGTGTPLTPLTKGGTGTPPSKTEIDRLHKQGVMAYQAGDLSEAIAYYRQVLEINPNYAKTHNNLAIALKKQGNLSAAIAHYRQAITWGDANELPFPNIYHNLANALEDIGEFSEAIEYYREAIHLSPDFAESHYNLAVLLNNFGQTEEAIAHYQEAIKHNPNFAQAYSNLGNTFKELKQFSEAINCYEQAILIQPNYAEAHWNLGITLLLTGEIKRGFAEYEWRWQTQDFPRRSFPQPLWDGSPLNGKTILLYSEQGFGDIIQFIRYVSLVAQQGGRIIVECDRALARLFQTVPYIQQIAIKGEPLPEFHCHSPLMSLPYLFGTTLQTIPANIPYIYNHIPGLEVASISQGNLEGSSHIPPLTKGGLGGVPPGLEVASISQGKLEGSSHIPPLTKGGLGGVPPGLGDSILLNPNFKIGIVWAGNPKHKQDKLRSCELKYFLPLRNLPGVQLYSLQKGDRVQDLNAHQPGQAWEHCPYEREDLNAHQPGQAWEHCPYEREDLNAQQPGQAWEHYPYEREDLNAHKPGQAWEHGPYERDDLNAHKPGQAWEHCPYEREELVTIENLDKRLNDFADTAAVVAQLDLVLTVDTAVAHLVGAMGKPVWLLLGNHQDWRWMQEREDSPWYPTMRIFRQSQPGDWEDVFNRVFYALQETLNEREKSTDSSQLKIKRLQHIIDQQPNYAEAYHNLGYQFKQQGDLLKAIAHYQKAVEIKPDYFKAHYHLGNGLLALNQIPEAIAHYEQAIKLEPQQADAHTNLGFALLMSGDMTRGFAEYEWRVQRDDPQKLPLSQPAWDGSAMPGKTILLYSEEGFGDSIQFIRYVPLVAKKFAQVIVQVPPQLLRLFETISGSDRVISETDNLPDFDVHASLMSLPHLLGTTWETIPATIPYLSAGSPLTPLKKGGTGTPLTPLTKGGTGTPLTPLTKGGTGTPLPPLPPLPPLTKGGTGTSKTIVGVVPPCLPPTQPNPPKTIVGVVPPCLPRNKMVSDYKIGIVWAGSDRYGNQRDRSCQLADFCYLMDIPGLSFYSLQVGEETAELTENTLPVPGIIDLGSDFEDFADTAWAIAQLDLVITIDTSVAHLAGAMGKTVWVLLPFAPDCRWMLNRADSPWYPTMRLFRQPQPGDWNSVFHQVKLALISSRDSNITKTPMNVSSNVRLRLGLGWQLSQMTGWGIYGMNLTLKLLKTPSHSGFYPVLLMPPAVNEAGLNPLHRSLLQPIFSNYKQLQALIAKNPGKQIACDFPVIHALGKNLTSLEIPRGNKNIGVIFLEDTNLSPEAYQNAQKYDIVIAGSTWNEQVLKHRGISQVCTVQQGIDPTIFHPAPPSNLLGDRFVIFSGCKLEFRKGQDIVIAAFKEFRRRHPDALLMTAWHNFWPQYMQGLEETGNVVGLPQVSDNKQIKIADWLIANGLPPDSFINLGMIANHQMGQILREANVAIFTSRCEGGTNLAAMESMACGIPTILSANTGHLDLMSDRHCYPLSRQRPVKPTPHFSGVDGWGESDVNEVVETLEKIYTNRQEAQQKGFNAAKFMQSWTWEKQVQRFLSVVRDIL